MNEVRPGLEKYEPYTGLHRIALQRPLDPHGNQWPDTVPTGLDEAAPEGGQHREPSKTINGDEVGVLGSLLWPLGVVAALAALAVLLR